MTGYEGVAKIRGVRSLSTTSLNVIAVVAVVALLASARLARETYWAGVPTVVAVTVMSKALNQLWQRRQTPR